MVIETEENLSHLEEMSNSDNENIQTQESTNNHSLSDDNDESGSGSFDSDDSDDTPENNSGPSDEPDMEDDHKASITNDEILEERVLTPNRSLTNAEAATTATTTTNSSSSTTETLNNSRIGTEKSEGTTITAAATESETASAATKPLLPRIFNQIVLTLENSLIPAYKLEETPSHLDGLDAETEKDLRILGCEFIQTAGILLRLPQVAMATGQVIFQRFFYSKSFVRHGMETVAMSCVCLASKIEEAPRRIRDVINVFHHIKQVRAQREITPMVLDQYYTNLKTQVIKAERRVLKELGFCVHVKHPHKLIVMYLQVMKLETNEQVMQMSWNFMNDSLRTDCFMRYNPETIACACIYLSARKLNIPLPYEPPWFGVFNVAEDDVIDISYRIMELYMRAKPSVEKLDAAVDELKKRYNESRTKTKEQNSSPAVTTIDRNNGSHNAWGGFIQRTIPLPLPSEKSDYKNSSRSSHSMSRSPKYRSHTRSHSLRSRSPTPGSVDYSNKHHHNSKKTHRNRSRSRSRSPHGKGKKKTTRHFSRSPSKSLSPNLQHRKRKLSRERERSEYYNVKEPRFSNNEKYRDRERYDIHRPLSNHRSSSKHHRRYAHHGNNQKHREVERSRDRKR